MNCLVQDRIHSPDCPLHPVGARHSSTHAMAATGRQSVSVARLRLSLNAVTGVVYPVPHGGACTTDRSLAGSTGLSEAQPPSS